MGVPKGGKFLIGLIKDLINSSASTRKAEELYRVHSAKDFRTILERERSRSDRSGNEFSLISIESESLNRNSGPDPKFLGALARRIRSTDEVGWLEGRIGVFLPDTSAKGAWKLADDLCRIMNGNTPPLKCTVYNYPFTNQTVSDKSSREILRVDFFRSRA